MAISVCDTSILSRNGRSHKEFLKEVKTWLKLNFLNKSFINVETGYEIFINNTFINKVTSSFGDVKAHSFTVIPNIIKNAVFIETENDKKHRPDIINILKFESIIEVDKRQYNAWIYVRENKAGFQLYSLNINVQKTP